jgi:hypothetical protein
MKEEHCFKDDEKNNCCYLGSLKDDSVDFISFTISSDFLNIGLEDETLFRNSFYELTYLLFVLYRGKSFFL